MRISDWSSDVCSSDLTQFRYQFAQAQHVLVNGLGDLPFSEFPAIGDFKGANGCIPNGLGTPSRKFIVAQAVPGVFGGRLIQQVVAVRVVPVRSEEHTSELQSLMRISYAVFCLKKKKEIKTDNSKTSQKIRKYK